MVIMRTVFKINTIQDIKRSVVCTEIYIHLHNYLNINENSRIFENDEYYVKTLIT